MLHLKTGCGCNEEGTTNGTHTCDQETGTCFCENGWFGEKCYLGKFIQKYSHGQNESNKGPSLLI